MKSPCLAEGLDRMALRSNSPLWSYPAIADKLSAGYKLVNINGTSFHSTLGYDNFFPARWSESGVATNGNNPALESRHKTLFEKLRAWPRSASFKALDITMLSLLLRLLLFSPDERSTSRATEAAQLRYATMLEKYLRASMGGDRAAAASKLAEGLTLQILAREAAELQGIGFRV